MSADRLLARVARPPAYHHGDLRRVLVDAATALAAEAGDWGFSLREVARRAGVSHNAPYNHFTDRRDLLAAVASAGFNTLRNAMEQAAADAPDAGAALLAIGVAYARFGIESPARYRLMFGPALFSAETGPHDAVVQAATKAKAVLREVVSRCAQEGLFAAGPVDRATQDLVVTSVWSLVHGVVLLAKDGLTDVSVPDIESTVEGALRLLLDGARSTGMGLRSGGHQTRR